MTGKSPPGGSVNIVERTARSSLELVGEIAAAVTAGVPLQDVLSDVARRVALAFDVWECDFYEYDHERDRVIAAACWARELNDADREWIGQEYDVVDAHGLAPALRERRIVQEHVDDPGLSADDAALLEQWGEKSAVSVPLVFEDRVLGCLSLIEKRHVRHFSRDDEELLRTLALPAAVAIHNAKLYRDLEARAHHLTSLLDSTRAVTSTVVLEDVLALVARTAGEALDVPSCLIFEYDPESDALIWRSEYLGGPARESEDRLGMAYSLADYPEDRAVMLGGEVHESHVDDPDLDEITRQSMLEWHELSCLTVPIVFEGNPVGLLEIVETRRNRVFTGEEKEMARALGEQAAVAIHNAQLYRRLEAQNERLESLNRRLQAFVDLAEEMRGLVDEGELLDLLGRVMRDVNGYRQWAAYVYRPADQGYRVASSAGNPNVDENLVGRVVPERVIAGLIDAATMISRSYFVDHQKHEWTDEEHHWLPGDVLEPRPDAEWHDDDTLLVPLRGERGDLIGYFEAYDPLDGRRPTEDDVRLLEVFAAKAAGSIELSRLHERLEEQARTDGLTGLANHRYLLERLDQEVAKARRYGTPLSLLMIDLDDFKPFNDTFGHPQGDKLLRAVADVLRGATRDKVDLVARYGGEEFVVVLPNTPASGADAVAERLRGDVADEDPDALSVAERIRAGVADTRFEGFAEGRDATMTLSVGVATFPEHASDPAGLVIAADKALYLAKRLGKNRVQVYE